MPAGNDGVQAVSIASTDTAGNPNTPATGSISYTIDNTAPVSYTVAIGPSYIISSNQTSIPFTFALAEVGTGYAYTVTSSGGGTAVTGAGTVSSPTDTVTGMNLSGLGDGTITLSVILTDAAGNAGSPATDTVTKDTAVPTVVLATVHPDTIVRDADTIVITATFSEAVFTPTITIGSVVISGVMTGSGTAWEYSWDVPAGNNGAQAISVSGHDAAGNPNAGATGFVSCTIDNVAPTVVLTKNHVDAIVRGADTVTITATFSETVLAPAITIGTVVTGDAMSGSGSVWTYAWNVPAGNDGVQAVSITAVDVAGNANSAATGFISCTIDNIIPVITSGTYSTPDGSLLTNMTFVVDGTGSSVTLYSITGAANPSPTTSSASSFSVKLTGGSPYVIHAAITDAAGNVSAVKDLSITTGTSFSLRTAPPLTSSDDTGNLVFSSPSIPAVYNPGAARLVSWTVPSSAPAERTGTAAQARVQSVRPSASPASLQSVEQPNLSLDSLHAVALVRARGTAPVRAARETPVERVKPKQSAVDKASPESPVKSDFGSGTPSLLAPSAAQTREAVPGPKLPSSPSLPGSDSRNTCLPFCMPRRGKEYDCE